MERVITVGGFVFDLRGVRPGPGIATWQPDVGAGDMASLEVLICLLILAAKAEFEKILSIHVYSLEPVPLKVGPTFLYPLQT